MTVEGQKFKHYAGASRRVWVPLLYPGARPFDQAVTSAEWRCGPSAALVDEDLYIRKTLGSGVSIELVNGVPMMRVSLRPADTVLGTNGLKLGSHYWEARIGWGLDDDTPVATGTMELKRRL